MYPERKKLKFEVLISTLLSNFGRLILTNLIFAIPFLSSVAISWALFRFVAPHFLFIPLPLLLASPFYPGVVLLSREYAQGNRPSGILKTYIKAVKDNALRFLICGLLLYIAVLGCYYGFTVYRTMAAGISFIFYLPLFFVFLIAIFFLFFFYAVPLMTVSFELKTKAVFKNSALMTFGEFKNNFFATVGILFFLAIVMFPMLLIPYLISVLSSG